MKESIEKRISLIKAAETPEDLKKCLCPFFDKGGYPECLTCRKTEADLDSCRDYYLERSKLDPQELWSEEFDKFIIQDRDKVSLEEVVGIGVNCDSCYMYDKCPLYKKGYACGIKWDNDRPNTPAEFMDFLINTQYERVKRSAVFEKIDGGVPDVGLSNEIDRLHDLISSKSAMGRDRLSISVEATRADSSHAAGGGILAKLFGGGAAALPEAKPSTESAAPILVSSKGIHDAEPEKPSRQRKK